MALAPGVRFGPYEIAAQIGVGSCYVWLRFQQCAEQEWRTDVHKDSATWR